MSVRNILSTVGCTVVALGALAFPAYANEVPDVSGSVQALSLRECLNTGGRPNYFGSHTVCEGGSRSGEDIN